jgi:hypothetical protein
MMSLHPFEKAGLGKAPFHCSHVVDSWSACQFCGTAIRYQYHIAGADGSHFFVGSDCVAKTGGAIHIDQFKNVKSAFLKAKRDAVKKARHEALKAKWAAEAAVKRAAFEAAHPGVYETMKFLSAGSNFCANMVSAIDRFGDLTPRQLEVAERIMNEHLAKERDKASGANKLAGDLKPLADMFKSAREHLKFPKLTVEIDSKPYTFSLAGDASRNPGFIYVKSAGTYLGKVSPAGEISLSRDAGEADREAVSKFSLNPAAVAGLHGHLTGACCFCSKKLTDERSVEVGYGATCAKHYNLPWG